MLQVREWGCSFRGQYRIWSWAAKGIDQVYGYENCSNRLIPVTTMGGGKENLWILDTLKHSISKFILVEKTLKGIKTGAGITAPISAFPLQTHHVYSTLKRRRNDCLSVVSTWNTRSLFVGALWKLSVLVPVFLYCIAYDLLSNVIRLKTNSETTFNNF